MNGTLVLAVGDELSFVLDARIGAFLSQEIRAEHLLALGAVPDADTWEYNWEHSVKLANFHIIRSVNSKTTEDVEMTPSKFFIQQNYLKIVATLRKINIGPPSDRNVIIYFFHRVVKLISFTHVVFIYKLRVALA